MRNQSRTSNFYFKKKKGNISGVIDISQRNGQVLCPPLKMHKYHGVEKSMLIRILHLQ